MEINRATVFENSSFALMDRIVGDNGSYPVRADLTSITVKVFDTDSDDQVGSTLTPSVASVFYDTLQTNNGWSKDTTGYNFRIDMSGDYVPSGGRVYRVEVKFVPAAGNAFYSLWDVQVEKVYSE